jgi:hypothetical protein
VNNFPGPQKYDIQPLITGKGHIFLSKYKSSPGRSIYGKYADPSMKNSSIISY